MEASEVKHADLKKGQLRNLLVATFASIFAYWAWSVISPLAKFYSSPDQMHLDEGGSSLLIAMPVLVGAVGRIPAGALTDKYGGRVMLTAVMALSAPLTLLVALAGSMKSFGLMLVFSFLLGIAGTVFAVGIPFSAAWYGASKKGFATGIYGVSTVGTAVSAFVTPILHRQLGYWPTHILLAALCLVMAAVCFTVLRDSPQFTRSTEPIIPKLLAASRVKETWQLCFLYSIFFGAFVAVSNYLPTFLTNVYEKNLIEAGMRASGFAVAAVAARPLGGILADRVGPRLVTLIGMGGTVVLGASVAFQPEGEHVYGPLFLMMAVLLGLGCGSVFGWVGRAIPADKVGIASGIIGAAGGLGGFFPPLVMGATYNAAANSYFNGLMLLALTAAVGVGMTLIVRGGKKSLDAP